MTGYDWFTTPCSSDASHGGNRSATTTPLSYADALAKTASESIEAIVRKRRILFAEFVARMEEERMPQRVMFGELVVGKDYSGGQEKNWMVHLKEDMSAFGMTFEEWRKTAQKAGRWIRRIEEGAESFMRNWHDTEMQSCRATRKGRGGAIHRWHL